jgi:hypothetical protein
LKPPGEFEKKAEVAMSGIVLKFPGPSKHGRPSGFVQSGHVQGRGNRFVNWLKRSVRSFLLKLLRLLLALILSAALIAAQVTRMCFGILAIGFAGKVYVHWGQPPVSTPILEFGASLLIFVVLTALLSLVSPAKRVEARQIRLSWFDRALLMSRR